MDHNQAVREKATERYLLNELDPDVRDQFEEHLFDCQDCALDVRSAAMFVEQSKVVLAEKPETAPARVPVAAPAPSGWFGWMRPAFAVPVFALLLVVIGYQGETNARLHRAANTPRILPLATINIDVRGTEPVPVQAHGEHAFVLSLNVPPKRGYSSYKLDLYSPQGTLEWSDTIPATAEDTLSVVVPERDHEPGTLVVSGITDAGKSDNLGRHLIELQNQK